jgi:hypothetical protein
MMARQVLDTLEKGSYGENDVLHYLFVSRHVLDICPHR